MVNSYHAAGRLIVMLNRNLILVNIVIVRNNLLPPCKSNQLVGISGGTFISVKKTVFALIAMVRRTKVRSE